VLGEFTICFLWVAALYEFNAAFNPESVHHTEQGKESKGREAPMMEAAES
jgi:hypothetical protein